MTTREQIRVGFLRKLRSLSRFWQMARPLLGGCPAIGDANAMVRPANYERLLGELQLPDRLPPLARLERIAPGEASAIARMVRRAALTVIENYCGAKQAVHSANAMRDQHAKSHGCLHATFIVRDNLRPELAVGVFQPGARYQAIVRFSNAQGTRKSDRYPDGRGMAIKLLGVPGRNILTRSDLEAPPSTDQDFLLTNYPVFFGKNVNDYAEFLELIASPRVTWGATFQFIIKLLIFFAPRLRQLWIFLRTAFQRIDSPLRATYYSMTPYLLGDDRVVRYLAVPVQTPRPSEDSDRQLPDEDFLRRTLAGELHPRTQPPVDRAVFDFCVQLRDGATADDVEDASRAWRGPDDATIPLARIEIPLQEFDVPQRWYRGETLSFSPWHCLGPHRPLGGLNRMRLAVYRTSLEVRHRLNMVPP